MITQISKKITQIVFIIIFIAAFDVWAKVVEEHILIVPAGTVDKNILKAIKVRLPDMVPAVSRAEIMPAEKLPEEAYNSARKQYDAVKLLGYISGRITIATTSETLLVIVDADIYTPDKEFVLGYADPKKVMCILSLSRLRNESHGIKPDHRLFVERVMKEALKELGGAWGLSQCASHKCVMYSSATLSDIDRKKELFCHECRKRLRNRYVAPMFNMPQL